MGPRWKRAAPVERRRRGPRTPRGDLKAPSARDRFSWGRYSERTSVDGLSNLDRASDPRSRGAGRYARRILRLWQGWTHSKRMLLRAPRGGKVLPRGTARQTLLRDTGGFGEGRASDQERGRVERHSNRRSGLLDSLIDASRPKIGAVGSSREVVLARPAALRSEAVLPTLSLWRPVRAGT